MIIPNLHIGSADYVSSSLITTRILKDSLTSTLINRDCLLAYPKWMSLKLKQVTCIKYDLLQTIKVTQTMLIVQTSPSSSSTSSASNTVPRGNSTFSLGTGTNVGLSDAGYQANTFLRCYDRKVVILSFTFQNNMPKDTHFQQIIMFLTLLIRTTVCMLFFCFLSFPLLFSIIISYLRSNNLIKCGANI